MLNGGAAEQLDGGPDEPFGLIAEGGSQGIKLPP